MLRDCVLGKNLDEQLYSVSFVPYPRKCWPLCSLILGLFLSMAPGHHSPFIIRRFDRFGDISTLPTRFVPTRTDRSSG